MKAQSPHVPTLVGVAIIVVLLLGVYHIAGGRKFAKK